MPQRLLTESGNNLVMETVAGISGASSLNDITVKEIQKEKFTLTPVGRINYGSGWAWDDINNNMGSI